MFNAETARSGIPTVGTEAPGQGGCRLDDVRRYEEGLLNLLRYRQMIAGEEVVDDALSPRSPLPVLAPTDGIFVSDCRTGEVVAEGQLLGRLIDTFGTTRAEIVATRSGEVWALRTFASVYRGELLVWIAFS